MLKIKIEQFKSSYRLRFTYPRGKRNTITIAPATKAGLVKAQQASQLIELDILNNSFDLSKYSQPLQQAPSIYTLWEYYKQVKQDITSTTTQLETWRQTDSCLNKLPTTLLRLDKANEAVAYLLKIYSVGTLERVLANLKAACNLATQTQQINSNPYQHIKLPKRRRVQIECFSDDEIKAIFEIFANTRHSNYVQFLAYTFCRPGEACALTIDDIDLRRNIIKFDKAYSRGILKETKNNKARLFPINNQLLSLVLILVDSDCQTCFTNTLSRRLDHRDWAREVWKPAITQLVNQGRVKKYLKCYCLRHSGITRMIRAGYDVATVASLAGTSSEMIFRNYLASKDIDSIKVPEL
jgi:integrase